MTRYSSFETHSIGLLREAADEHGEGLRILTGFDTEAPLALRVAQKAGIARRLLTIDTGFWFSETHNYRREVEHTEGIIRSAVTVYTPSLTDIERIKETELWHTDLAEYNRLTKLEPLSRAVRELGITALVTGVRATQTANRSNLQEITPGSYGETRVNAMLSWTDEAVEDYFADERLPRHPLAAQGYGSVGDWPITLPGAGREGRLLGDKSECGLHIADEQ